MAVPHVSSNRPQEPSLPLISPASLESKVKSVALAILTAATVSVLVYLISFSWPVSLLVGGITLLLLCMWIYYINRPIEAEPQPSLEEVPPATIPIAPAQRPSPQEAVPIHVDSTSAVSTSAQTSLIEEPIIEEPVSQSPPVRAASPTSYQWQKSLRHLMYEARSNCTETHLEKCREILDANKDHLNEAINGNLENGTILHLLAKIGPAPFVAIFKEYGVDFTIIDESPYKNSALHWAIANAQNGTALEIIRHAPTETLNIQCGFRGNTPLHLTIAKGYIDRSYHKDPVECPNFGLTKALIERGARIDIPNYARKTRARKTRPLSGGNTALHIACARRDSATLQLLMTKNPSLSLPNNNSQSGPDLIHSTYQEACDLLNTVVNDVFVLNETDFNANEKVAHDILYP